ncbi:MAG: secretin and TonB N-terminal domain-containing protein, partial [Pseudomonas alloputida]
MRHAIRAVLFGTALGLATAPQLSVAADTAEVSHDYAIPAGQLTDVLNKIARQAGITLSSTPQLTDGLHSNGLQGKFTTDQALRQLLNGSGLEAVSQGGRNYVLQAQRQSAALALPDTDIRSFSLGNALGSMEGYNATHSQVATKTSMPLVETSQSVSVVTRQQMDDQGSQTVAQAMRYTPGVLTNPYGATHR